MFTEIQELRERLQCLRQAGMRVADLLQISADQLETQGEAPSPFVCQELQSFRDQFREISALFEYADTLGEGGRFESINDMEHAFECRSAARHATDVARSVLRIESTNHQGVTGLAELRAQAQEIIASQGMHLTREQLADFEDGRHAWCDLLKMINEHDSLDDSAWTTLNESLLTSLGAPLAIAAARGRFIVRPSDGNRPSPLAQTPLEETPLLTGMSCQLPERQHSQLPMKESSDSAPLGSDQRLVTAHVHEDSILEAVPACLASDVIPVEVASENATGEELFSGADATLTCSFDTSPTSELPSTLEAGHVPESELLPLNTRHDHSAEQVDDRVTTQDSVITPEQSESQGEPLILDGGRLVLPVPHDAGKENLRTGSPATLVPGIVREELQAPPSVPSSARNTAIVSDNSIFADDPDEDERWISGASLPHPVSADWDSESDGMMEHSPLAEKLLAAAHFEDATGPVASLAMMIQNRSEEERDALLADLILHLIHQGRPGLAYHLSRCLEALGSNRHPFVPSWLIRVWTFGHALVFPKGQLAGLLQDDLKNHRAAQLPFAGREWQQSISLLIRAATLRPAIIAPSTRAASILRDFDLQGGCVQLYNYCSRIGSYGERLQGVFPSLFKQSGANAPYSEQLSQLRRDIESWRTSTETVPITLQLAAPLYQKAGWSLRAGSGLRHPEATSAWSQWQMALRHGNSLIQPILDDRRQELTRIRGEVEEIANRLSAQDQADVMTSQTLPEIRVYLRQVITFSQRWIGLHAVAATSDAQNYLPQPAAELRSEIQQRHVGVMQELQTLASEESSFEVRMAVACLMLSVMEIRNLVDPNVATDSREPDPRHLLHSELLKIAGLQLGANWEPDDDPHALLHELLSFLCQPQPDWATAFKMHLARGNHQLAERILSLSIWTEEERDALQGVLEADRARIRTGFIRDLAKVRSLLLESARLDILSESERSGYETRINRLDRLSSSETDVTPGIQELDKVRDSLLKRREREAERIRNRLLQLGADSARTATETPLTNSSPTPTPRSPQWKMDFNL